MYAFAFVVFLAAVVTAAPASPLHEAMLRVQSAAAGTDHAAFTGALGEAKRLASAAPAGEEREAAQRALHVYDDLARLWRYSQESSTGAFFEGGELLTMLHAYPGYDRAVAGDTVIAGEHTLYPAAESRAFLAREAARRLATRPEPAASAPATPAPAPAPVEHKTRPPVLRKKPEEVATQKPPHPKPAPPASTAVPPAVVPPSPSTSSAAPQTATVVATTIATTTVPTVPPPIATPPTSTAPPDTTTSAAPVNATAVAPATSMTQPATTTAAPPATVSDSTTSDSAPAMQPLSVSGMARTIIAIGLIVAAAASLIYLLRSSK